MKEVFLDPPTIQANPEAMRAILEADLVVFGPGSLLTSVLPNLLVEGIRRASSLARAQGLRLQRRHPARRDGRLQRQRPLRRAAGAPQGSSPFDYVLANSNTEAVLPEEWHSEPVRIDRIDLDGARVMKADVVAEENRYRHDSKKLADALIRLYYERNQMTDAAKADDGVSRERWARQ